MTSPTWEELFILAVIVAVGTRIIMRWARR